MSIMEIVFTIGSQTNFLIWLFFAASLVYQIRTHLWGILVGSFSIGNIRGATCRKLAKAATKEQPLWRRITMTYIGDYVSKRLRKPYKMYMVFKAVFDIWIILGGPFTVALNSVEIPYSAMIQGVNILGLTVFNAVMLLFYNPNTRETRFVDFMY